MTSAVRTARYYFSTSIFYIPHVHHRGFPLWRFLHSSSFTHLLFLYCLMLLVCEYTFWGLVLFYLRGGGGVDCVVSRGRAVFRVRQDRTGVLSYVSWSGG
jgi:hypothetical protein